MVATYAEEAQHIKDILFFTIYLISTTLIFLGGVYFLKKDNGDGRRVPLLFMIIFSVIGFFAIGFIMGAKMLYYSANQVF